MGDAQSDGARIRRERTLARIDELRESSTLPAAELEAATLVAVRRVAEYARATTPYYSEALAGLADTSRYTQLHDLMDDLPVLTRQHLQTSGSAMRNVPPDAPAGLYVESHTSGSTGQPVTVVKHAPNFAIDFDAVTLLDWQWHQRPLDGTVAMFRVLDADGSGPMGPPLSFIGCQAAAHWRNIATATPAQMVDLIHEVTPHTVFCNGVVLRQLCLEQSATARPAIQVARFVTVSDRIDAPLRALVRDCFGGVVEDRYSSEELGCIAIQCPVHDHLHVIAGSLHVEIVDDDGVPCEPGESGRVLVTSLRPDAQPLIRYEIGDRATWGASCDAGISWPVIERIDGRLRDGVTLPDGTFHMVTLTATALISATSIRDYVCVLFDDAVLVLVDADGAVDPGLVAAIERDVAEAFQLPRPVVVRQMPLSATFGFWKRREWYRGIGSYGPEMSDTQVLAALAG